MADDIYIKIKTLLEKASPEEVAKLQRDIQNKIQPVKLKIETDAKGLDKFTQTTKQALGEVENISERTKEWTQSLGVTAKETEKIDKNTGQINETVRKLTINYKEMNKLFDKQRAEIDAAIQKTIADRKKEQLVLEEKQSQIINKNIEAEIKRTMQLKEQLALYKQRMLGDSTVRGELDIFADKYKGKYDKDALSKIRSDVEALNISTPDLNTKIKQTGNQFTLLKKEAGEAGSVISRTFENLFKFMRFYLVGGTFVKLLSSFRQGVENLHQIDDALISIAKVTEYTRKEMEQLASTGIDVSKEYGRSVQDYLSAVTEFSRAGFGKDAQKYAELSLLLQNVGDVTAEVANETLIAANAGFQLGGSYEALMGIIDKFNHVSNLNATNINKLSEAMKVGAATFHSAGLSIDETVALIGTATASTQRAGAEVSRAFRTILMNIRQIKDEEAEVTEESMANAEKALNAIGIVVRDTPNTYRPMFDILRDLGNAFENLTPVQQAFTAESLANKRQADILISTLQNWNTVEKQLNESIGSSGSALRENEIYLQSWSAATSRLSSSLTSLYNNLLDTDSIISFINLLDKIVISSDTLINNQFSSAIIQIGLLTSGILLLNKGLILLKSSTLYSVASQYLAIAATKGWVVANTALIATTKTLTATLLASPLFWTVAVVAGIYGIVKAIDALNVTMEEYNEQVNESYNKTQNNIESIKSLKKEYEELSKQTELSKDQKLRLIEIERELKTKYGETTKELDLQNKSLEENSRIIDEAMRKEAERFKILNERAYKEAKELLNQPFTIDLGEGAVERFESIEEAIKHYEEVLRDATDKSNYVYNARKKVLEDLYKEYDNAIDIVDKYEGYEQLLGNTIKEVNKRIVDQFGSIFDLKQNLEDLNNSTNKLTDSLDDLSNAYTTLNEGKSLSTKQIIELIEKYPQLQSAIKVVEGQLYLEKDAIYAVMKAEEEKFKIQIEQWKQEAINHKNAVLAKIHLYHEEIKTVQDVLDARQKLIDSYKDSPEAQDFIGAGLTFYDNVAKELRTVEERIGYLQSLGTVDFTKQAITPSTSSSGAKKEIKEIAQYLSDDLAQAVDEVNLAIKESEYRMSKYNEESQEYRNELNKQIKLQEKLQEIYHLIADRLRDRNEEIKKSSLFQKEWNLLTEEQKKELNKLKKEFDDNAKSIDSYGISWQNSQEAINGYNKKLVEISYTLKDLRYEYFNDLLVISDNRMMSLANSSAEYSKELLKQTFIRKQSQSEVLKEIKVLNEEIKAEKNNTIAKQEKIERLKTLVNRYYELERSIIDTQNKLDDIEFNKFENSLKQIDRQITPFINKISNLKSNFELLSETNFDGKIGVLNETIQANMGYVSQLEQQLLNLLSVVPKNAKEAQSLSESIEKTKQALRLAKVETIQYSRELSKLQLEKIQFRFDKITNSLMKQIDVYEYMIDAMIEGLPTGLSIDFNYVVEGSNEVSGLEDTQDNLIDVTKTFNEDMIEAQKDYNVQILEESREFFNEQIEQMSKFFEEFLDIVQRINSVKIFDTTLSDFARLNGANEETIETLKKLEKQMFEALYKNWKNTKENVGKIVDENNDGIDDITGEWISGYDTILQETKDYFTNLISEFSNNWDKINKIVKDKIAEQSEIIQSTLVDNSKNDVPMPGNIVITDETLKPIPDDKPIPNNKPIPDDKPKIRTKVKTFSPDRYIIENGVSYAPEMYFPVDILLSDSLPKIIRNGIVYFGIKAAYQNAGNYDVEWDGTNVVVYSYAKGTNSHPGGKAIISEEGKELIIYPNGKLGLSNDDGAELVDLPKGTQVIPNKETEKILKNYSYAEGILKYSLSAQYIDRFTKAKSSESSWFSLEANDILDDGTIVNSFTEYYWGDTGEFIGEKIPTQEQIKEHISLNKSVVSIPKIEDMPQVGYSQAIYPIKHAQRTKTARSQSTPYFEQHTGGGAPEGTTEYYWGDTGVLIGIEKPNKDEIIDHYGKGSPYLTSVDPPPLEVKPIDVEDSVSEVYEKSIEDAKKIVDNLQEQIDILTAISNLSIGDYYEDEKGEVIKVDQTIIDTAKSKAIETTTALISARQKLSKIIKESMEYELQAREDVNDGLTDTIAKEDTLKNKISLLHKEDFVGLTNQNNELLVNQKLQKEILKELEDKARIERDTFEEGSIEWNILDAQIKKYIKNIEQIDIVIKDTVDDIKLLSFDALNNSFENFIRNIDVKLSDLDFASEFIDDGDFQSQIDNINAIIEAGLDKITTLTDKIENIAINADTAEWWAGLDSDQQEEFISEWQNELQSTILLVFNAQKQISDIQKQKLQKMSAYENEIIQMIRKRVEIEKEALNEQLKLTQDNIDQRIKYINKLYDESSYEDSLKEEELLLKELYDERAKWLLDDSLEGQNKVKEIDKKILEQEKSIAKTKRQRSKDLRIEALNEEKENAQKITEEKQKQLDEQLRNDNLYAEAQKVIQTGQIEFLIVANGEVVKINGEAQTGIMDLSSAFGLFVDTYGEGLSLLGGQIKSDFIDGITLANKEIDELIISIGNLSSAEGYKEFTKDKTTITPETANVTPKEPPRGYNITDKKQIDQLIVEEFNNPHNFDTNAAKLGMLSNDEMDKLLNIMYLPSNKDIAERITNTTSYDDYQSALGELFSRYEERGKNIVDRDSIVELLIEELINPELFDTSVVALSKLSDDETELLYTFMKFPSNNDLFERLNNMISYDDYQSALGELLKRFKLFPIDQIVSAEDGALTPSWGKSGKLAILHEKELVLNKLDTKNILKTVDITRNILSNFKLPNLSNLFSGTSNKIDFSINNLIRVDGNVDKNTLPGLKDIANYTINKLKTEFNKQGVFRGV